MFSACPDGEGRWTWRDASAQQYRRKGSFTAPLVDWYCRSLASCELAPLVLVDIGGRPSAENRRILTEGKIDHMIILSGTDVAMLEWERFATECGVSVIATIKSDYQGTADLIVQTSPILSGSIHHLERGEDISGRPMILASATLLQSLAVAPQGEAAGIEQGMLKLERLAEDLGKPISSKKFPNGVVVNHIVWEAADLLSCRDHLASHVIPETVYIDGFMTVWHVDALVEFLQPRRVLLNSPDGYVQVGCHPPANGGAGVQCWISRTMKPTSSGRPVVWVEFQLDPSFPFKPEDLGTVAPPEVEQGAIVILSGRGPKWLVSSVSQAYKGHAAAVACFQPGVGATVSWSRVEDVALGQIFDAL
ncbi:MAG: CRISPR-associated protein Csx3 [bacterium]